MDATATTLGAYIVIDTEGNGLFDYKKPADAEGQPRLAALAIVECDADDNVISRTVHYIKPDGWSMDPKATEVNGLTDEFLHANGVPVKDALMVYSGFIRRGYFVVAFNAQHDCKAMRAELRRADLDDLFAQTKNVCVMRKANGPIPKASGKKGWPSMEEARNFLDLPHEGAHQAGKDADDAHAIYKYLKSKGVDLTPEVHFAKGRD